MAIETVPEWMAGLEDEDVAFIKKFLLASGSLKEVAGLYGVTYPTVRLRLDRLIQKIHLSEDTAADPYVALVKRLAVADKLDFDTATADPELQKNERGGCVMAIITTLVGLGVLLVFTVLGCVLEVFLARRESIWPGLVLPILAGLYAVVMALSYTAAPDTPWNQVLGGVLAVFLVSGIPAFLLLMVFFICRSGRRRKKQLEKMNVQDL